jgi:hypothetical protein
MGIVGISVYEDDFEDVTTTPEILKMTLNTKLG